MRSRTPPKLWLSLILLSVIGLSCSPRRDSTGVTATPTPVASAAVKVHPSPLFDHPYQGRGVVVLVNLKEGWIEINHEDIEGLMPAMQMEFLVKDLSLLQSVKAGDKVDFTVVETQKGEYLTQIKKQSVVR